MDYRKQFNIPEREERRIPAEELRVVGGDGEPVRVVGYAAVFNSLSVDMGGWQEKIAPGTFQKTLQESDVRALWNHNSDFVLGRTKNGTLKLEEDDHGLRFELTPPDTTWARDFLVSIERGDVDQMSFGFRTVRDEWDESGNIPIRTLREVELLEISPVTFPAYESTSVLVRAWSDVARAVARVNEGQATEDDWRLLRTTYGHLRELLDAAPGQEPHPAEAPQEEQPEEPQERLRVLRARLAIAMQDQKN